MPIKILVIDDEESMCNFMEIMLAKAGYNVDTVILAEEPNLKAFKQKMGFLIANELAIDEAAVNIKATTTEGLGFVGQKQGIAAYATVTLIKKTK